MAILSSGNAAMKSSHWYCADGTPMHRMAKSNGDGDRATTIADARKLRLLPSVTNVIGILAKPALDEWKLEQVAKACFDSQPQKDEPFDYYKRRVKDAAFEQVADAADLGTLIHQALDNAFEGKPWDPECSKYIAPVLAWIHEKKLKVTGREETMVSASEGYAGRTDVFFTWEPLLKGMGILDYKTKKTKPGEKVCSYLEHKMQLAAYAAVKYGPANLPKVIAANVFISTTEIGRVEIIKTENLEIYYECFLHACALWRVIKEYDPRRQGDGANAKQ